MSAGYELVRVKREWVPGWLWVSDRLPGLRKIITEMWESGDPDRLADAAFIMGLFDAMATVAEGITSERDVLLAERDRAVKERDNSIAAHTSALKWAYAIEAERDRYREADSAYLSLRVELARIFGEVKPREGETWNAAMLARIAEKLVNADLADRYREALEQIAENETYAPVEGSAVGRVILPYEIARH